MGRSNLKGLFKSSFVTCYSSVVSKAVLSYDIFCLSLRAAAKGSSPSLEVEGANSYRKRKKRKYKTMICTTYIAKLNIESDQNVRGTNSDIHPLPIWCSLCYAFKVLGALGKPIDC